MTTTTDTSTVPADQVVEGDFLAGLDGGYVAAVETPPTMSDGRITSAYPDFVQIGFHTADSWVGFLIVPGDTPVQIRARSMSTCRHCGRGVVESGGRWINPEATGDDSIWRETCESHDTFPAEHEPA